MVFQVCLLQAVLKRHTDIPVPLTQPGPSSYRPDPGLRSPAVGSGGPL